MLRTMNAKARFILTLSHFAALVDSRGVSNRNAVFKNAARVSSLMPL